MANNENFNVFNVKTRSGHTPSTDELFFKITTEDVMDYLQRRMDGLVHKMRNSNNGSDEVYTGEDINLSIVTIRVTEKFLPFSVMLPTAVLKSYNRRGRIKGESSIFNPKEEDGTEVMYKLFTEMFKSYVFTDGEIKYLSSNEGAKVRSEMDLSMKNIDAMRRNKAPKIQRFNNGNMEKVTFLLDPIKIFHDMLTIENNTAPFKTNVIGNKKISDGSYIYYVQRTYANNKNGKKKKKDDYSVVSELTRRMS